MVFSCWFAGWWSGYKDDYKQKQKATTYFNALSRLQRKCRD
jgi:hypothetical protein